MYGEPDSDADNLHAIEVTDTPARDNPAYGAVQVILTAARSLNSTTVRITRQDAETLKAKLTDYLAKES